MGRERQRTIVRLYTKDKLSMMQIAQKFHLSASGVRYCLQKNGIQRRSLSEAISSIHITKFRKPPFSLKSELNETEKALKIAGIMLYWGEGAKSGNTVKFVNSDPEMIKLFLKFLRAVCGISENRLKALVHVYPDHNRTKLEMFWSRITKIPRRRFYKTYVHQGRVGTYKTKSTHGTLALNYSDKQLLKTILQWTEAYRRELVG